jgi:hypothetical protein
MEQHRDEHVHNGNSPPVRSLAWPLLIWFTIAGLIILGTIGFFLLVREYSRSSASVGEPAVAKSDTATATAFARGAALRYERSGGTVGPALATGLSADRRGRSAQSSNADGPHWSCS